MKINIKRYPYINKAAALLLAITLIFPTSYILTNAAGASIQYTLLTPEGEAVGGGSLSNSHEYYEQMIYTDVSAPEKVTYNGKSYSYLELSPVYYMDRSGTILQCGAAGRYSYNFKYQTFSYFICPVKLLGGPLEVSFLSLDGNTIDTSYGDYDDTTKQYTFDSPEAPQISGKAFLGWSTSPDTLNQVSGSIGGGDGNLQTEDGLNYTLNLYAYYVDTVSVSFDLNGGTGTAPASIDYYPGGSFTYPAAAGIAKSGSCFTGWGETTTAQEDGGTVYKPGAQLKLPDGSPGAAYYAQWVPTFTLSYDLNGSTDTPPDPVPAQVQDDGTKLPVTVNSGTGFSRPGYTFTGWKDKDGNDVTPGSSLTLAENTTLYAQWEQVDYSIQFNANGASQGEIPSSLSKKFGESFTVPDAVTPLKKAKYIFDGWNTADKGEGASYAVGSEFTVDASTPTVTTLYVQWKPAKQCKVLYDGVASGVTDIPTDDNTYYNDGLSDEVTVSSATPKKPGYTFLGWNTDSEGNGTNYSPGDTFTITSSVTLYAKWEKNNYQITFDANGAVRGTMPNVIRPNYGASVNIPSPPTTPMKEQYIFAGWNTESDGTGNTLKPGDIYTIDDSVPVNLTLYAKWENAKSHTLSYQASDSGILGSPPGAETYYEDGFHNELTVAVPSMTRPGYDFAGWSTAAGGDPVYTGGETLSLTQDMTLYAKWTKGTYTLTYDANNNNESYHGTLPASITGNIDSSILASAQTIFWPHHRFTGWNTKSDNTDGSGAAYQPGAPICLDHSMTLYAQWEEVSPHTLTYDRGCGDLTIVIPTDNNQYYDDGISHQAVVDSVKPVRYGYDFTGWKDGDGNVYQPGATIKVTKDITLYAQWETKINKLKYDPNLAGAGNQELSGSVPAEVTGNVDSTVAVENADGFRVKYHTFVKWNTEPDGSGTDYAPGDPLGLGNSVTLYAQWKADTYQVQYDKNGSSVTGDVPDSVSGTYDQTFLVPGGGNLKKPGSYFAGWNTEPDGSGNDYVPTGNDYHFHENITLYAKWVDTPYNISFHINGADAGNPPAALTPRYGEEAVLPTPGIQKNYKIFDGWNTEQNGNGTHYQPGDKIKIEDGTPERILLYAQWKNADSYVLKYDYNGSGATGNLPADKKYYNDGLNEIVTVTAEEPKLPGYRFEGFRTTPTGAAVYHAGDTFQITEDTTLYAIWEKEYYWLTYNANGSEVAGDVPPSVKGSVTDDIPAAGHGNLTWAHHTFTGWKDGDGRTYAPGTTINLTADTTLYAQWKEARALHLTYNSGCSDNTVITPTDTTDYYDDGISGTAEVSSETPIRFGYDFKGWTINADGSGTVYHGGDTIDLTGDTTLYAQWEKGRYTLIYDLSDPAAEGMKPDNVSGTMDKKIEAAKEEGFSLKHHWLKGWSTEAGGGGTFYAPGAQVILGRNMTLYAVWEKLTYTVTYDKNISTETGIDPERATGSAPGAVSGTYTDSFEAAGSGELKWPEYRFDGWNTKWDGSGNTYAVGTTYSFEENIKLYAQWKAVNPFIVKYYKGDRDVTGEVPKDNNRYGEGGDSGDQVTVLGSGTLKKPGYFFEGWNTKADRSGNTYREGDTFTITSHTGLYAKWKVGTYKLTYNKNSSAATGAPPAEKKYTSQQDIKAAGAGSLELKSHEFTGWNTKSNGKGKSYKTGQSFRIMEDTVLYAQWKKLINVSFDSQGGGKLSGTTEFEVTEGTRLGSLPVPEVSDGYVIKEWIVNGQKVNNPGEFILEKNSEVQLVLEKKEGPKKPDKDNSDHSNDDNSSDHNSDTGGNHNSNGNDTGSSQNQGQTSSVEKGTRYLEEKNENSGQNNRYTGENAGSGTFGDGDADGGGVAGGNTADGYAEKSGVMGESALGQLFGLNCILHWLLLLGLVISLLYTSLRILRIRTGSVDESNFVLDQMLPLLPVPLSIAAYFFRGCYLDLWMTAIWILTAVLSAWIIRREIKKEYNKTMDQINENFQELETDWTRQKI